MKRNVQVTRRNAKRLETVQVVSWLILECFQELITPFVSQKQLNSESSKTKGHFTLSPAVWNYSSLLGNKYGKTLKLKTLKAHTLYSVLKKSIRS